MEPTSLTDIIAAQRAYAAARTQAMEAARAPGADPKAAVRIQHQALLQYLQTRVSLLTTAREKAMEQSDVEIAKYQQKIGQVQQLLQEGAATTASTTAPAAATAPTAGAPAKPGGPENAPATAA